MELTLESGTVIHNATEDDVRSLIQSEEFAILEIDTHTYIQCAEQKDPPYDYVLEYQDGSLAQHYRAIDGPITPARVVSAFLKYLSGDNSWRSDFRWKNVANEIEKQIADQERGRKTANFFGWLVIAFGIVVLVIVCLILFRAAK